VRERERWRKEKTQKRRENAEIPEQRPTVSPMRKSIVVAEREQKPAVQRVTKRETSSEK